MCLFTNNCIPPLQLFALSPPSRLPPTPPPSPFHHLRSVGPACGTPPRQQAAHPGGPLAVGRHPVRPGAGSPRQAHGPAGHGRDAGHAAAAPHGRRLPSQGGAHAAAWPVSAPAQEVHVPLSPLCLSHTMENHREHAFLGLKNGDYSQKMHKNCQNVHINSSFSP